MQKLLTFFSKNISIYAIFNDPSFNDTITKDVVSFEQLGFASYCLFVCLFVLMFYGPVNPMESCRTRSVYLTTRLLGRLSPLSG